MRPGGPKDKDKALREDAMLQFLPYLGPGQSVLFNTRQLSPAEIRSGGRVFEIFLPDLQLLRVYFLLQGRTLLAQVQKFRNAEHTVK